MKLIITNTLIENADRVWVGLKIDGNHRNPICREVWLFWSVMDDFSVGYSGAFKLNNEVSADYYHDFTPTHSPSGHVGSGETRVTTFT